MALTKEKLYEQLDTIQKDFLIVEENGNEITVQFEVEEDMIKSKYDESSDVLQTLNTQFEEDEVMSDEWDYKSNFTNEEIQELSKTHDITYDIVQQSNEDTSQTEVIIFKEKE